MLQVGKIQEFGTGDIESKHIYVGETRIVTKQRSVGNNNYGQEKVNQYYYHGDHLGSAQVVTNYKGELYEHLEYTPYGELWIERTAEEGNLLPFRFTGKEYDRETGLYYYGARYLDPRTSRWISTDPAMGEYIPGAPINDEVKKHNQNLPGMGGVFNYVNLHVYHYAGNNPVKLVDPNGMFFGKSLTDDQWNEVDSARNTAVHYLDRMISEINDYISGESQTISSDIVEGAKDWLDKDIFSSESYADLANDLRKIRNTLSSMKRSDFKYDSEFDGYAWINPFSGKITLGTLYFSAFTAWSGNDTKPGVLVHEASHSFRVLSTSDFAYGGRDSYRLRNSTIDIFGVRTNAWQNADNWEYYFERYGTGGEKRWP